MKYPPVSGLEWPLSVNDPSVTLRPDNNHVLVGRYVMFVLAMDAFISIPQLSAD